MPKIEEWMSCGAMYTHANVESETTVDDTFRVIEAFDSLLGVHNLDMDIGTNTVSPVITGTFDISCSLDFEGSKKQFEIYVFKNNVQTVVGTIDKGTGTLSFAYTVDVVAGDTFDIRQRSTNGGVALTISDATFKFVRLT